MVNNRQFCISGSIFGGYKTDINLDLVESIDDIIDEVTSRIRDDIKKYPEILIELNKEKEKFHIHNYDFGDILISDEKTIFYVCNHC